MFVSNKLFCPQGDLTVLTASCLLTCRRLIRVCRNACISDCTLTALMSQNSAGAFRASAVMKCLLLRRDLVLSTPFDDVNFQIKYKTKSHLTWS